MLRIPHFLDNRLTVNCEILATCIRTATFRFVAKCLNHNATAFPPKHSYVQIKKKSTRESRIYTLYNTLQLSSKVCKTKSCILHVSCCSVFKFSHSVEDNKLMKFFRNLVGVTENVKDINVLVFNFYLKSPLFSLLTKGHKTSQSVDIKCRIYLVFFYDLKTADILLAT
jgi:hypothetical protein